MSSGGADTTGLNHERTTKSPQPMTFSRRRNAALGLPEILALVALLVIILSTLIPMQNRARTRSGVSRAKSDLLRLGTALDIYHLDNRSYPASVTTLSGTSIPPAIYGEKFLPPQTSHKYALYPLTTPVAYLLSMQFNSPFPARAWEITESERRPEPHSYWYNNYGDFWQTARGVVAPYPKDGYLVMAFGPRSQGVAGISAPYREIMSGATNTPVLNRPNGAHVFDPSNGLSSPGNIFRFGGRLGLENGVPYLPVEGVE